MQDYIMQAEKDLLHTYNRYPIVFERGDGVYLYDREGKKYLDFFAGIAVNALGYHYRDFDETLKKQIDRLLHISNYFYNEQTVEAAGKLKRASGMDRVFFTNSGAEAIEGALKAARKYAYTRDGHADAEIIAMNHSFHGRTMGALSVTGNPHYREAFEPLIGNIRFADLNDFESVKRQMTEKTCAVLLETVQGEGGVYPAEREFLEQVKALCEERDMLLILDEIQCGMGRSGAMFAWQKYGVKPDVMTVAKALGNGVPIGAFLASGKAAQAMQPGDHGTTYGGNPLVCAAASRVLDIFEKDKIVEHVQQMGAYLWEKLEELMAKHDCMVAHRGCGLIQGLEFAMPVGPVVQNALMKQHLVLISAGSHVIRFVPPLVIQEGDVDEMIARLERAVVEVTMSR